jgi:hypothetical protein
VTFISLGFAALLLAACGAPVRQQDPVWTRTESTTVEPATAALCVARWLQLQGSGYSAWLDRDFSVAAPTEDTAELSVKMVDISTEALPYLVIRFARSAPDSLRLEARGRDDLEPQLSQALSACLTPPRGTSRAKPADLPIERPTKWTT